MAQYIVVIFEYNCYILWFCFASSNRFCQFKRQISDQFPTIKGQILLLAALIPPCGIALSIRTKRYSVKFKDCSLSFGWGCDIIKHEFLYPDVYHVHSEGICIERGGSAKCWKEKCPLCLNGQAVKLNC